MKPDESSESQLESLQRRWETDPSPHLSLQLADLHRQRGRMTEALSVLERGLAEHPGHVSVRVALGRCRLEAGNPEAAEGALLAVVDKDPAHLVANKLLVRAYVALGDQQRAADRLALYAVLNDGDPELEALRVAVGGMPPGVSSTAAVSAPFAAAAAPLAIDLTRVRPPVRRRLRGALDRAPFADLASAPLEPSPLGAIFGAAFGMEPETQADPRPRIRVEPERRPEPAETLGEERDRPLAPREIDGGAGATATLGALYLAQDHLEDAEDTFEQVLARHPDDAEARAGLDEVARRREAERRAHPPKTAAGGDRGGTIALLERYLGRIRAAADRLSA